MRTLALVSLLASLAGAPGCAAISNLASENPIVIATDFEQAANTADQIALVAANIALGFLPAADQATASADIGKSQATFLDAMLALDAAKKAYQDGTGAPPDWPSLIIHVQQAITALVAAVDVWAINKVGGAAKGSMMSPAFVTQRTSVTNALSVVNRYH